jgi:hypothetical protein
VLTQLGSALGGWRPSRVPGDPLGTIRAGWAELVGADVARAAQPVAIVGSALIVVTGSGAWSHQLTFLERSILAGIVALGVDGIERLRFRVGTPRTRTPGSTLVRTRRPTVGGAPGRPGTPEEALARLRAQIEAQRSAHAAAGGAFCADCAAPIAASPRSDAGTTMCRPCAYTHERERREACDRILFQAPWLASEEVLALVPGLTADAYDRYRRALLRSWLDELRLTRRRHAARAPVDPARIRQLASSYVLLETRIDPNRLELDSPIRQNALGEDLYRFIRDVEGDASLVRGDG